MGNQFADQLLTLSISILFFCLYVWSIVWAYQDAERRGKSGVLIALIAALFWPLGIIGWLFLRPANIKKAYDKRR